MFSYRDSRGPVEVVFTDRHGGPQAATPLDLAEPPPGAAPAERTALEDRLDAVARALADDAGTSPPAVARMRQVHGSRVLTVDRAWLGAWQAEQPDPPEVDGLVTDLPGVALLVRVADCVPVLLADPDRRVVGVAHAGRQGLALGVVPTAVRRMRELGAEQLVGWLGPHVCGRCYEVPAAMREEVAAVVPESFAETSWGTPALDVGAGVVAQLEAEAVEVVDASRCTLEDDALHSYRRDGAEAGRLGGLVWVRP